MKKRIIFTFVLLLIFFVPFIGVAQGVIQIPNPFRCTGGECTLMGLILAIFNNIILPIAAVLVTLWIVWAGFMFIKAQGNQKDIQDAKQNLLWSLVGAGILLGAVGIARVVEMTIRNLMTIP